MSNGAQLEFALWVLLAMALGAAVGLQREFRGHEAGIRTAGLVCGGAAVFGRVSLLFAGDDRVAASVVQGIGFLGAGLILHREHGLRGVTTAATVWVVAGLGLIVSLELWLTALVLTVAYVAFLELAPLSDWIYMRGTGRRHVDAGESAEDDG
ncbi:MAG: MgtC/SapB family protein [Dehalococcoidia bacterium]